MRIRFVLAFTALTAATAIGGTLYRWVDKNGTIHYSDSPPSSAKRIERVETPDSPEFAKPSQSSGGATGLWEVRVTTQSPEDPGPLPDNQSSEYLETLGGGIAIREKKQGSVLEDVRWSISVRVKPNVPEGAVLEAHFYDAAQPYAPMVVEKILDRTTIAQSMDISILSPILAAIRCGSFPVTINVFSDRSKARLLGTHVQYFRSMIDSSLSDPVGRLFESTSGGRPACREAIQPGENLVFYIPVGWGLLNRSRMANEALEEYIAFGDSFPKWRGLVSVTTFYAQRIAPTEALTSAQEIAARSCDKSLTHPVVPSPNDGPPAASTVVVCGEVPGTDQAEVAALKAITGRNNSYLISRAWRTQGGPPEAILKKFEDQLPEGRRLLDSVWLCGSGELEQPCPLPARLQ